MEAARARLLNSCSTTNLKIKRNDINQNNNYLFSWRFWKICIPLNILSTILIALIFGMHSNIGTFFSLIGGFIIGMGACYYIDKHPKN